MSFLSFVLNGVILVLLAATIYFTIRLSLSLRAFRDSRADLNTLVATLSRSIDQAQIAIAGLREVAREGGKELEAKIKEARALSDELDVITQSGESLAKRLEGVASRARESGGQSGMAGTAALFRGAAPSRLSSAEKTFSIRDRDLDEAAQGLAPAVSGSREGDRAASPFSGAQANAPDDEPDDGLHSKAERDLYAALRKGGGKAGAS